MKRLALFFMLFFVLFFAAQLSHAITINVPADQPTIGEGIIAATDGDTVLVANGTYTGDNNRDLDFGGKLIVLKSVNGRDFTTIDCEATSLDPHHGIYFTNGEDTTAVVEGFTITGACLGPNGAGGAIGCGASSPLIKDCRFIGNRAAGGAGMYCVDAAPIVRNCEFISNRAFAGAGIYLHISMGAVVEDCRFENNIADTTESYPDDICYGGGVASRDGLATIRNCIFIGNRAGSLDTSISEGCGGAMLLDCVMDSITDCVFSNNVATYSGAIDIFFPDPAVTEITNCLMTGNTAWQAGAIGINYGIQEFINCTLSGNSADLGSSIVSYGDGSTGIFDNCIIAFGIGDDAVLCDYTPTMASSERAKFIGATENDGKFVLVRRDDNFIRSASESTTVDQAITAGTISLTCCDVYGNEAGDWTGCIADQAGINGNFSAHPYFCDTANGDYQIIDSSACAPANNGCLQLVGAYGVGCVWSDDDSDGIAGIYDNCPDDYNPGQTDTDGDGEGDACEDDTDGDGVLDDVDNCLLIVNPLQENGDADTLGDACDNCPGITNQDQANSDTDEFGDVCDNCPSDDNPGQENSDADTYGDACDNCPDITNEDQINNDSDQFGDVCDNCPEDDNPGQENTDGDAFGNVCDNCPERFNPDQANSDGDELGDLCDNCPQVTNAGQEDADGDGKGDACDVGEVDFSATPRCGSASLTVDFTDLSVPLGTITEWHWEFGDGGESDVQHPSHEYTTTDVFDVMLAISDGTHFDTLTRAGYITTQDSVSVDFVGIPTSGKAPLTVMFSPVIEGVANGFYWEFGDGDTSGIENPVHIYQSAGSYDVKFRAQLELGSCSQVDSLIKEDYIAVRELEAQFSADQTAGIAPHHVQFTDESTGNPDSWYWDFGDDGTSMEQHPLHTYEDPGAYDVFLRVGNSAGDLDSVLELQHILVQTEPVPDLYAEIYALGARPGFEMWYYYVWTNIGTEPAENCSLKILLPSAMELYELKNRDNMIITHYGQSGDTILLRLSAIEPSNWYGGYIRVFGRLSETFPIGDTLVAEMWLTSTTAEEYYGNNYVIDYLEVVGSIDPNDKQASPGGKQPAFGIGPNQRISYLVQFENKPEATAEAIYVRVVDTLDPNLDWSTLSMGAMSHPDACDWEFDPYTGVITWFCDDIMLPPNVAPPEGEGYFNFSISPKPGLPHGTHIPNTVWIRFDYNEWLQGPEYGPIVRTITYPCVCTHFCDVTGDGLINPVDVVYMVNYVYKQLDARVQITDCLGDNGDWNCDGAINPVDVVWYVNYVYKSSGYGPCDPCACDPYPENCPVFP